MLSYLAIAIGAPVMAIFLAIMASPQTQAGSSNALAGVNASNGEKLAVFSLLSPAAIIRATISNRARPDPAPDGICGVTTVYATLPAPAVETFLAPPSVVNFFTGTGCAALGRDWNRAGSAGLIHDSDLFAFDPASNPATDVTLGTVRLTNPAHTWISLGEVVTGPCQAADRNTTAMRESPPNSGMECTKGTILVHGSLNGSVRPPVDEPWQRWLQ